MSTESAILSKKTISTQCCKEIRVSMASAYLLSRVPFNDFISVSFSIKSKFDNIFINFNAICEKKIESIIPIFYPNNYSINMNDAFTTEIKLAYSGVIDKSTQCYLNFTLSGELSYGYEIIYTSPVIFNSTSYLPILPSPKLYSAYFSSSGNSIEIIFDLTTNRATLPLIFNCDFLFYFSSSNGSTIIDSSSCIWSTDNRTVFLVSKLLGVGDNIHLKNSYLTPGCISGNCPIASYQSTNSHVAIDTPKLVIPPKVYLYCPSSIGASENLKIDLTQSSGNGNRNWKSYHIKVSTLYDNSTEIQSFLDSSYKIYPPTSIPNELLKQGVSYSFLAEMCNFLGYCDSSSCTVTVYSSYVPSIRILGPKFRKHVITSNLTLTSKTDGLIENMIFVEYYWEVYKNSSLVDVKSSSKDASVFFLTSNNLEIGITYEIKINLFDTRYKKYSSDSVTIITVLSEVIAYINNSDTQIIRQGDNLLIDAGGSYLASDPFKTGKQAGLNFRWSFIQTSPSFDTKCASLFSGPAPTSEKILLGSNNALIGTECIVKLIVFDYYNQNFDSKSVTVRVVSNSIPYLNIFGTRSIRSSDEYLNLN